MTVPKMAARRFRAPLLLLALTAATTTATAAPLRYVLRDELLCDATGQTCLEGTLTYAKNDRLLHLWARVRTATGPGLMRILLSGTTRQGHRRFTPFEFRIRGHATEIVDRKMIPDDPDVHDWTVWQVQFLPPEVAPPAPRQPPGG